MSRLNRRRLSLQEPDLDSIIDRAKSRLQKPYRRTESVRSMKSQWTEETSMSDSESSVSSISLSVALREDAIDESDEDDISMDEEQPVPRRRRAAKRCSIAERDGGLLINLSSHSGKKKGRRRRRATSLEALDMKSSGFAGGNNDFRRSLAQSSEGSNALLEMFDSHALLNPEPLKPKPTRVDEEDEEEEDDDDDVAEEKFDIFKAAAKRPVVASKKTREFEDLDEREFSFSNLGAKIDPSMLTPEEVATADETADSSAKKLKKKKKRKEKTSKKGGKNKNPSDSDDSESRRKSWEAEDLDKAKPIRPRPAGNKLFPSLSRTESMRFKMSANEWMRQKQAESDDERETTIPLKKESDESNTPNDALKNSEHSMRRSRSTDRSKDLRKGKSVRRARSTDRMEIGSSESSYDRSRQRAKSTDRMELSKASSSSKHSRRRAKSKDDELRGGDSSAKRRSRSTDTLEMRGSNHSTSRRRIKPADKTIEKEEETAETREAASSRLMRRTRSTEALDIGNVGVPMRSLMPNATVAPSSRDTSSFRNRLMRTTSVPALRTQMSSRAIRVEEAIERELDKSERGKKEDKPDISDKTAMLTYDIPTIHPRSRILERAYSQSSQDIDEEDEEEDEEEDDDDDIGLLNRSRSGRFDSILSNESSTDSDRDEGEGPSSSMMEYLKNRRNKSRGRATSNPSNDHVRSGSTDSGQIWTGRAEMLSRATSMRFGADKKKKGTDGKENRRRRRSLNDVDVEDIPASTAVGFTKLECDDCSSSRGIDRTRPLKSSLKSSSKSITSDAKSKDSSDAQSKASTRKSHKKKKDKKKYSGDKYSDNLDKFMKLNNKTGTDSPSAAPSKTSASVISKSRSVGVYHQKKKRTKSRSSKVRSSMSAVDRPEFSRAMSEELQAKSDDEFLRREKKEKKKKKKNKKTDESVESKPRGEEKLSSKSYHHRTTPAPRETRDRKESHRGGRRRRSVG